MKQRFIAPLIAAALLLPFILAWLAGAALSRPSRQLAGKLPADLVGQEVTFLSRSGATLRGWFIPGRPGGGAVVFLHGVRASRSSMLGRARFLSSAGYSVLLFDFQAHGESSGQQITFGYLESRDAQAAVDFIRSRAPGERIGLIGVSLGGAAALLAEPSLQVDAMILEMVYPTINQALTNRLIRRLGSWAGALSPLLLLQLKPRLGIAPAALRPLDKIAAVTTPKLIAGSEDEHTTVTESQALYQAAREPKNLWVVSGARHQDLHAFAKQEYEQRALALFEQTLRH